MIALTSRLAQVIVNLEEAWRQNKGLVKAKIEDKTKVNALEKELGEAKLKLVQAV